MVAVFLSKRPFMLHYKLTYYNNTLVLLTKVFKNKKKLNRLFKKYPTNFKEKYPTFHTIYYDIF